MKDIELLDCTLGIGAKLIDWKFGEEAINQMQRLLRQSRVDIVEIGKLQGYQMGPNYSIYSTGKLPAAFERVDGQLYAGWMSETRIDASSLPKHSEETIDIIRVPISSEDYRETLRYCAELKKKGYRIELMLDCTAELTEKERRDLFAKANRLNPWAFGIMDINGVMKPEELEEQAARIDRELDPQIRLGFHGADNLGLASELAQSLCRMRLDRTLCLDASVSGMCVGGCTLATEDVAEWLNENCRGNYELYTMMTLVEYIKPFVEPKRHASAKLAYHLTAERRCSYRYVEYYLSEVGLDISVIHDILAELSDKAAFHFDKRDANNALIAFRKKKLNLIVVVLTRKNWKAVDLLLFSTVKDFLKFGVDIEIFDGSEDEKTAAVVRNFQIDGYSNVFYRRCTEEGNGDYSLDRKVISAFREHLDYDYIWVCKDGLIPKIAAIYNQLLDCAQNKTDYIVVDAAFRNNMHYVSKSYDNCLDFFTDNSARTTILGCYILRSAAIRSIIERRPLNESNRGLWLCIAPLQELADADLRTRLIVGDVFDNNPNAAKRQPLGNDTLEQWGRRWYELITDLPSVYDPGKDTALRIQMADFHPFYLRQLLELRGRDAFNLSVLRRYKRYLTKVSDTAPWKYYAAALMPRFLARALVSHERSRLMQKTLAVYGKI